MQVFSRTAFAAHGKYFRLLHFTSEQSFGPKDQRAVLRFSFALPPAESMQDLTKLFSTVVAFTDILGNYKLSPDMRRRAEKVSIALSLAPLLLYHLYVRAVSLLTFVRFVRLMEYFPFFAL